MNMYTFNNLSFDILINIKFRKNKIIRNKILYFLFVDEKK